MSETVETPGDARRYHDPLKADQVIELLVAGRTARQAAEIVGVSVHTIYDWKRDPRFLAKLKERRADIIGELQDQLPSLAVLALDVYRRAMLQTPVDTAGAKLASEVLRSIGLIGDTHTAGEISKENLELVPIGVNAEGKVETLSDTETN